MDARSPESRQRDALVEPLFAGLHAHAPSAEVASPARRGAAGRGAWLALALALAASAAAAALWLV